MNQFTLFNYFLAVVALAAHYPIGKRLGIKPFFSACLTGIAFTALVVASFANIAAGLIRPYILISIAVGIGLLIYDGLRHRIHHTGSKFLLKTYLFIAIIAGIFFVLNNPAKIYFAYPDDGSVKMHYQEHYSYYASQSVEMLNARYFSRLKIANAYPYEWTTYHFFNSAAQAVVQGLIQHPTLLTYFIAQMLITLFVFLSFIEALFYLYGASTRSVIITLVWFIIGFTLFFDSIGWNAIGSGIFSIYAVIQLLFSLMSREYRKSIIFAGMLGASAFRMMPIALSIIGAFALYALLYFRLWREIKKIGQYCKKIPVIYYAAFTAFIFYNYITIFAIKNGQHLFNSLLSKDVFSAGWIYILTSFKIIGYISRFFGAEDIFRHYNEYGFFDRMIQHPFLNILFLNLLLLVILYILATLFGAIKVLRKKYIVGILILFFSILNIHYYLPTQFSYLHGIVIPYAVLIYVCIQRISASLKDKFQIRLLWIFSVIAFFSTLVLQYTGLDMHVKSPPLFTMYDILVWGMIAIYLHTVMISRKAIAAAVVGGMLLLALFPFAVKNLLKIQTYHDVDVSPLVRGDFNRSNYVDSTNMMKDDIADSVQADVYSAILGANLKYSEGYTTIMNYTFRRPLRP